MTTPLFGIGQSGFWYIYGDNATTYYQEPKVANLNDVDDYTGKPNYYVVANSDGTGWTYSNSNGSTPTTFAGLGDVDWGSAMANYFVVVNGEGTGLSYVPQSTLFSQVNNFYSLNDTFDYRTGTNANKLIQVNNAQNGLQMTNFGFAVLSLQQIDSSMTPCYFYTVGESSSLVNYYAFRPKSHFEFNISTDEGPTYQATLTGYDVQNVMYTRNSFGSEVPPSTFIPIAFGTINSGGPNNITTDQNLMFGISSPIWTFDGSDSFITLTDVMVGTVNAGTQPVFNGHYFKVNLSAYVQYHNNPTNQTVSNSIDIGFSVYDANNTYTYSLYDSCVIQPTKPGPSSKFAKQWLIQLFTGWSLQPCYRNIYLGSTNPGSEIDFVNVKINIDEV